MSFSSIFNNNISRVLNDSSIVVNAYYEEYKENKKDKSSILGVILGVALGLIAVVLIGIAGFFGIKKIKSSSKVYNN